MTADGEHLLQLCPRALPAVLRDATPRTCCEWLQRAVRAPATLTLRALATSQLIMLGIDTLGLAQGRRARHYHNHTLITASSMTVEEGQTLLESGKPVPKSLRRPHKDFPIALK